MTTKPFYSYSMSSTQRAAFLCFCDASKSNEGQQPPRPYRSLVSISTRKPRFSDDHLLSNVLNHEVVKSSHKEKNCCVDAEHMREYCAKSKWLTAGVEVTDMEAPAGQKQTEILFYPTPAESFKSCCYYSVGTAFIYDHVVSHREFHPKHSRFLCSTFLQIIVSEKKYATATRPGTRTEVMQL